MEITIPYTPRYPQGEIHKALEGHRFAVLVAHRRMGKTVLAVNHLIKRALCEGKERGFYAYIAPFRTQAKSIAWGYLQHYTKGIPDVVVNQQELSVVLPTGATIRLFGADNPDSLRGAYFDGAVIDEVAQIKPFLWGEVVRPALADRKGWTVFIGTPKGINLFSEIYDKALAAQQAGDKSWIALKYSVDDTKAIPARELKALRADMSDNEYRQEFLCDFAAASDDALIPIDLAREAAGRKYTEKDYSHSPVVIGVDVARFGNDASVIQVRQGLVAFDPIVIRKADTIALSTRIAAEMQKWAPMAVFIDMGGGQGVVDYLVSLGQKVTGVWFGGGASDSSQFANHRMEMWWEMKRWLEKGGAIPRNQLLQADLSAPTYGYNPKGAKILEPKEKIKERLGRSPDLGDALALTFAFPLRPRLTKRLSRHFGLGGMGSYDPDEAFDEMFRG